LAGAGLAVAVIHFMMRRHDNLIVTVSNRRCHTLSDIQASSSYGIRYITEY
jgi:hypothetical protein